MGKLKELLFRISSIFKTIHVSSFLSFLLLFILVIVNFKILINLRVLEKDIKYLKSTKINLEKQITDFITTESNSKKDQEKIFAEYKSKIETLTIRVAMMEFFKINKDLYQSGIYKIEFSGASIWSKRPDLVLFSYDIYNCTKTPCENLLDSESIGGVPDNFFIQKFSVNSEYFKGISKPFLHITFYDPNRSPVVILLIPNDANKDSGYQNVFRQLTLDKYTKETLENEVESYKIKQIDNNNFIIDIKKLYKTDLTTSTISVNSEGRIVVN